jgi:GTPase
MQPQINYQAIESQVSKVVQLELTEKLKRHNWGQTGGLRSIILRLIVAGDHERAIAEIKGYIASKHDYVAFQVRVEGHIQHCCDLIRAIQNKRNLPGLGTLSLAKRQELSEKVVEHFEELKNYLKQIERVEREVRMDDSRSTVWVVQIAWQCVVCLLVLAFFMEVNTGTLSSLGIVISHDVDTFVAFASKLLGFGN